VNTPIFPIGSQSSLAAVTSPHQEGDRADPFKKESAVCDAVTAIFIENGLSAMAFAFATNMNCAVQLEREPSLSI
jgi:hypothetical protein